MLAGLIPDLASLKLLMVSLSGFRSHWCLLDLIVLTRSIRLFTIAIFVLTIPLVYLAIDEAIKTYQKLHQVPQ